MKSGRKTARPLADVPHQENNLTGDAGTKSEVIDQIIDYAKNAVNIGMHHK